MCASACGPSAGLRRPGGSGLAAVGRAGRQALRAGTCFDLPLAARGPKRRPGGRSAVLFAWWMECPGGPCGSAPSSAAVAGLGDRRGLDDLLVASVEASGGVSAVSTGRGAESLPL